MGKKRKKEKLMTILRVKPREYIDMKDDDEDDIMNAFEQEYETTRPLNVDPSLGQFLRCTSIDEN